MARGDMAVMDKPMAGGVVTDQEPRVERDAKPCLAARRAVDQLMRRRMSDLAQPKAIGEDQRGLFSVAERGIGGSEQGHGGQRKSDQGQDDQQGIGGGKFCTFGGVGFHQGQELVEQDGRCAHIGQGDP